MRTVTLAALLFATHAGALGCLDGAATDEHDGGPDAPPGTRDAAHDQATMDSAMDSTTMDSASDVSIDAHSPPQDGAGGLEIRPFVWTQDTDPVALVKEGGRVLLWHATQGGHVLRVGARIRGLESDTVEISSLMRDPEDDSIIAMEARTVVTQPVGDDGVWVETDRRVYSQANHIPLCPNYRAAPLANAKQILEVTVTELYTDEERTGFAKFDVIPRCPKGTAKDVALCECECAAEYELGKCH